METTVDWIMPAAYKAMVGIMGVFTSLKDDVGDGLDGF